MSEEAYLFAKAERRILVTGDRYWDDEQTVHRRLNRASRMRKVTIIEGGAKGADAAAAAWARANGTGHEQYRADWATHGRAAGPIRNRKMLAEGRPDRVLAFHPDLGSSKGTKDMVSAAHRAGVKTKVYGTGGKRVRDWKDAL
jgi:hypothetical protein